MSVRARVRGNLGQCMHLGTQIHFLTAFASGGVYYIRDPQISGQLSVTC